MYINFSANYDTSLYNRKVLFDGGPADPNYVPLPEDRPGGYGWGEGRQLNEQREQ